MDMNTCKPELEKLIQIIHTTLKIEVGIFDLQSRLVACTRDYLQHKGKIVHAPSIQEVLANGNVLVNKPGCMPACSGCRFIGNCPATIEMLRSIRTHAGPLGVMTFTSFSMEGHDRITREIHSYVDALNLFSDFIADLVWQKNQGPGTSRLVQPPKPPFSLSDLKGHSPGLDRIKKTVTRLSSSRSTLVITGATGTGKGLLAKVIHHTGSRAQGPFVPVNCASIPDTLFESELFGYEEGAFTGAKKGGKPGRFELARGGTLFLDEIGEMPLHLQVKLLNVLQDSALQRVGGITMVPVDVRVIAATNQNLGDLVREKKFRADLFYRLNVIPIDLPSLAERKMDIDLLAKTFLEESNLRADKQIQYLSLPVLGLFHLHDWPGNIRELQNIIEYSVNMEDGEAITLESLPQWFLDRHKPDTGPDLSALTSFGPDIQSAARTAQRDTIFACLERHGHDLQGKKQVARELGISLRTLYRKIKPLTLNPLDLVYPRS